MGCASSYLEATMSLFRRRNSSSDDEERAKLERKLYIAKESPESDFDLSDCQMRSIPTGIYPLCKVYRKKQLYLNNNSLDTLDGGGQLSDLYLVEVLNISHNKFTKIPDDIKYLVSLTELYIQDNFITLLPDGIQHLQNLRILNCSNNKIQKLTPLLGKLKRLRALNIKGNSDLKELCPELCFASNIMLLELDCENITFPAKNITILGTTTIMKFLCDKMGEKYCSPVEEDIPDMSVQSPSHIDPFTKQCALTWDNLEADSIQQENKMHEATKLQREKMLTKFLQEQLSLDKEISKIHEAREIERQKLIKAIQDNEKEIECLIKNFIQFDYLKPEIIQQQLIHEQVEHDRLLEICRQNYDNIKKSEVLRAMEILLEEDCSIQHSKKQYEDSVSNVKQSMLMQELQSLEFIQDFLKTKDESRSVFIQQLLEDQNIQKAVVASLVERVDARSWSLNEEIALITSHLAKLSVIEQEKKKMHVMYNYNELLQQRVHLVTLLDDLLEQKNKRRKQLIETLKEMENQKDTSTDFWLRNYQKLLNAAPKTLLDISKHLDPILANYLLQEGVIHCLPFLVKFLFSGESLHKITSEDLKENGVLLLSDRESILRAINYYFETIYENGTVSCEPSAPAKTELEEHSIDFTKDILEEQSGGIVSLNEADDSVLESECVICMDNKCEMVFVPCGHMCCCQQCASEEVASCPMCRGNIERKIKVMLP